MTLFVPARHNVFVQWNSFCGFPWGCSESPHIQFCTKAIASTWFIMATESHWWPLIVTVGLQWPLAVLQFQCESCFFSANLCDLSCWMSFAESQVCFPFFLFSLWCRFDKRGLRSPRGQRHAAGAAAQVPWAQSAAPRGW